MTAAFVDRRRLAAARDRAGRLVFGDRFGLVLFLGCLCFVTLYWRAGIFITDNITLRAGLEALADGHLWIEPATGDYLQSPGTSVYEGYVYGRNYGQLFLSLPVLWGLVGLEAIADLRVGLVALWHLVALAFVVQLGTALDRRRTVVLGGSAAVLVSFLLNVAVATPFGSVSPALLALQLTAAVASGFLAVALYRVVSLHASRTLGLVAGGAAVIAMPVGFWATVPKRHVFAALVCMEVLYLFTRSRQTGGRHVPALGTVPVYRAGAYASAGLLAWDHAAAGLFIVLALFVVDVPTAPSNDLRSLSFVGAVFFVSLLPMFLTNVAIAGDPFRPPRVLYGAGVEVQIDPGAASGGGESAGGGRPAGSGGSAGGGSRTPIWYWGPVAVLGDVLFAGYGALTRNWLYTKFHWLFVQVYELAQQGFAGLTRWEEVYRTVVRSRAAGLDEEARFVGVNLSMLEAAPLLGAVAVAAVQAGGAVSDALDRVEPADVLAVFLAVAFVVLYNERLPLNTTITVRYLLPLYPLLAFLAVRSPAVRRLVADHKPAIAFSYAGGVLLGGQLVLAVVVMFDFAAAEAVRLHAAIGLGLGVALGALLVGRCVVDRLDRPTAVAFGLAAAAGTVYLLLSGLLYFSFVGTYVLPLAGALSEVLAVGG